MTFYHYLVDKYGYDEPIFTEDVQEELEMNPNALRQQFKRLKDKGVIEKVKNGLYFIPQQKPLIGSPTISVNRIIERKFIKRDNNVIGYIKGEKLKNEINDLSQSSEKVTVVTNNTSSVQREVMFYETRVIIKKPRVKIANENYQLLQSLDLLTDDGLLSEKPLSEIAGNIKKYLKNFLITEADLKTYINAYPQKTKLRIYESGLYDWFKRRERDYL
ncbi:hypothetical protein [Salisediminibacterium halotolerans]|uniref:hypothetical protein n=1 Tax=Salisediminibacterium halotolerans TaxID=517425 RepID=UPI000EB0D5A9|nr:hypothetical protein [Salisediminibacterium halotolerans]RLJ72197.1 hypothetical protein BCL39_2088 [Actinophytocola xinjiangensis]RPE85410.1 hypothetical protein EDD67_2223 [Salisediminibacterium halotolerans]TWG33367.1 hypothetical protein BCL52_2085 [Salisediminibacterium halotolerans]GEL07104.1 hypothetical protein SHA02_05200 [Salisediminibacterium halotolerans]